MLALVGKFLAALPLRGIGTDTPVRRNAGHGRPWPRSVRMCTLIMTRDGTGWRPRRRLRQASRKAGHHGVGT
jgi:hypothetical protein